MDAKLTLKPFIFTIVDAEGNEFPGSQIWADDLEGAVDAARKHCKQFTLPGWKVKIDGVQYPAVMFKEDRGAPGEPRQRKRRRWL
jgi:hypothetical protein